MPERIQLKRTKGWRMQEYSRALNGLECVKVTRPGKWGNPFKAEECRAAGFTGTDQQIAQRCVEAFRVWLATPYWRNNWAGAESEAARNFMLMNIEELRGKNLACFCPLDHPCHADTLLELANKEPDDD